MHAVGVRVRPWIHIPPIPPTVTLQSPHVQPLPPTRTCCVLKVHATACCSHFIMLIQHYFHISDVNHGGYKKVTDGRQPAR
jgi:hypothetical protein